MSSRSLRCNCREIVLGEKNLKANLGPQSPAATVCSADYDDSLTAHSPHSSSLTINPTPHVIHPSIQQTIYRAVVMLILLLIYRCLYAQLLQFMRGRPMRIVFQINFRTNLGYLYSSSRSCSQAPSVL